MNHKLRMSTKKNLQNYGGATGRENTGFLYQKVGYWCGIEGAVGSKNDGFSYQKVDY